MWCFLWLFLMCFILATAEFLELELEYPPFSHSQRGNINEGVDLSTWRHGYGWPDCSLKTKGKTKIDDRWLTIKQQWLNTSQSIRAPMESPFNTGVSEPERPLNTSGTEQDGLHNLWQEGQKRGSEKDRTFITVASYISVHVNNCKWASRMS